MPYHPITACPTILSLLALPSYHCLPYHPITACPTILSLLALPPTILSLLALPSYHCSPYHPITARPTTLSLLALPSLAMVTLDTMSDKLLPHASMVAPSSAGRMLRMWPTLTQHATSSSAAPLSHRLAHTKVRIVQKPVAGGGAGRRGGEGKMRAAGEAE